MQFLFSKTTIYFVGSWAWSKGCSAVPLKIVGVTIANCTLDFVNCFAISNCNEAEKIKMYRLLCWSASRVTFHGHFYYSYYRYTLRLYRSCWLNHNLKADNACLFIYRSSKGTVADYFVSSSFLSLRTSLAFSKAT